MVRNHTTYLHECYHVQSLLSSSSCHRYVRIPILFYQPLLPHWLSIQSLQKLLEGHRRPPHISREGHVVDTVRQLFWEHWFAGSPTSNCTTRPWECTPHTNRFSTPDTVHTFHRGTNLSGSIQGTYHPNLSPVQTTVMRLFDQLKWCTPQNPLRKVPEPESIIES